MAVEVVNANVNRYMRKLLSRHDEPVLLEMEELASQRNFPIINRHVGVTVEILARTIGARRVFELGSGYGYSAFFFARSVGEGGEVHCTDSDHQNAKTAKEFLLRAGLWNKVTFHVGDAVTLFKRTEGVWDIIYNDIDKEGYPQAWCVARDRIRVGGLYICDNVLWSGRVAEKRRGNAREKSTEAIREHNDMVAKDHHYLSSILPIRDGLMVALRLS